MAGVKGRSGRKRKSLEAHILEGTWRPDRHGPRPSSFSGNNVLSLPQASSIEPPAELLAGLGDTAAAYVRTVFADFEPSKTEQFVLRSAAESLDRAIAIRACIDRDGLMPNRSPHPLLRHERAAHAQFLAAVRQLNLEK